MKVIVTAMLAIMLVPAAWAAEGAPARVVTATVTEKTLSSTTRLSGILDFDRVSLVSGEVAGLIVAQHVVEGREVSAAAPLVELNTDLLRKDMDIKRKQRAQTSADLEKTARSLKRLEDLLQKNTASRQAYDDALYEHRALQKKGETLDEEMARLQIELDKKTVRAPFDGLVLEKLKEQGEWLNPGSPVARIASTDKLVARIELPEGLVRFQQMGAAVEVNIPALDTSIEGTVLAIVPVADIRSKTVSLKIALPWQAGMIRNMSVSVELPSAKAQRLRMVPRDAVIRFKGMDFVYTVKDGKAAILPVEIVARQGDMVAVEKPPVVAGMPVVIDGNDRLQPDQAVQVIEAR